MFDKKLLSITSNFLHVFFHDLFSFVYPWNFSVLFMYMCKYINEHRFIIHIYIYMYAYIHIYITLVRSH